MYKPILCLPNLRTRYIARMILLAAVLFLSGCGTLSSTAMKWFDEPELRNVPDAKIDPATGEVLSPRLI